MSNTLLDYIESLDSGIQNALDQMAKAPRGAVVSASDVIGMLSIFKNQTMDAKFKALKGEIK